MKPKTSMIPSGSCGYRPGNFRIEVVDVPPTKDLLVDGMILPRGGRGYGIICQNNTIAAYRSAFSWSSLYISFTEDKFVWAGRKHDLISKYGKSLKIDPIPLKNSEALIFSRGSIKNLRNFDPIPTDSILDISLDEAKDGIRGCLRASFNHYISKLAGRQLILPVSSGLDSPYLMHLAAEFGLRPICVTIYRKSVPLDKSEVPIAKELVSKYGFQHQIIEYDAEDGGYSDLAFKSVEINELPYRWCVQMSAAFYQIARRFSEMAEDICLFSGSDSDAVFSGPGKIPKNARGDSESLRWQHTRINWCGHFGRGLPRWVEKRVYDYFNIDSHYPFSHPLVTEFAFRMPVNVLPPSKLKGFFFDVVYEDMKRTDVYHKIPVERGAGLQTFRDTTKDFQDDVLRKHLESSYGYPPEVQIDPVEDLRLF